MFAASIHRIFILLTILFFLVAIIECGNGKKKKARKSGIKNKDTKISQEKRNPLVSTEFGGTESSLSLNHAESSNEPIPVADEEIVVSSSVVSEPEELKEKDDENKEEGEEEEEGEQWQQIKSKKKSRKYDENERKEIFVCTEFKIYEDELITEAMKIYRKRDLGDEKNKRKARKSLETKIYKRLMEKHAPSKQFQCKELYPLIEQVLAKIEKEEYRDYEKNEALESKRQDEKDDENKKEGEQCRKYVFQCAEFKIDENELITEAMDFYKYQPRDVREEKNGWEARRSMEVIIYKRLMENHAPSEEFRCKELYPLIEQVLGKIENGEYKDYEEKALVFKCQELKEIDEDEIIIVTMNFHKNPPQIVQKEKDRQQKLHLLRVSIYKKLMLRNAPSPSHSVEEFQLEDNKKNDLHRRIDYFLDKIIEGEYKDYENKSMGFKCYEFKIEENELDTMAIYFYKYKPISVQEEKNEWEARNLLKDIIYKQLLSNYAHSKGFQLSVANRNELFWQIEQVLSKLEEGKYKNYEFEFKCKEFIIGKEELIIVVMDYIKHPPKSIEEGQNTLEVKIYSHLLGNHAPSKEFQLPKVKSNELYHIIYIILAGIKEGEYKDYEEKTLEFEIDEEELIIITLDFYKNPPKDVRTKSTPEEALNELKENIFLKYRARNLSSKQFKLLHPQKQKFNKQIEKILDKIKAGEYKEYEEYEEKSLNFVDENKLRDLFKYVKENLGEKNHLIMQKQIFGLYLALNNLSILNPNGRGGKTYEYKLTTAQRYHLNGFIQKLIYDYFDAKKEEVIYRKSRWQKFKKLPITAVKKPKDKAADFEINETLLNELMNDIIQKSTNRLRKTMHKYSALFEITFGLYVKETGYSLDTMKEEQIEKVDLAILELMFEGTERIDETKLRNLIINKLLSDQNLNDEVRQGKLEKPIEQFVDLYLNQEKIHKLSKKESWYLQSVIYEILYENVDPELELDFGTKIVENAKEAINAANQRENEIAPQSWWWWNLPAVVAPVFVDPYTNVPINAPIMIYYQQFPTIQEYNIHHQQPGTGVFMPPTRAVHNNSQIPSSSSSSSSLNPWAQPFSPLTNEVTKEKSNIPSKATNNKSYASILARTKDRSSFPTLKAENPIANKEHNQGFEEGKTDSKAKGINEKKVDEKEREKKQKEGEESYMEMLLEEKKKKLADIGVKQEEKHIGREKEEKERKESKISKVSHQKEEKMELPKKLLKEKKKWADIADEEEEKKQKEKETKENEMQESEKIAGESLPTLVASQGGTGIWKNKPSFASVISQSTQLQSTKNVLAKKLTIKENPKFPSLSSTKIQLQNIAKQQGNSAFSAQFPHLVSSSSQFRQEQQKEGSKNTKGNPPKWKETMKSWDKKPTGRSDVPKW